MNEPARIVFEEGWGGRTFCGAPLVEAVLTVFVGACQACGVPCDEQLEGSVLVNPLQIDGVLYGDAFCVGCFEGESSDVVVVEPRVVPEEDERLA